MIDLNKLLEQKKATFNIKLSVQKKIILPILIQGYKSTSFLISVQNFLERNLCTTVN